jgi:hypothetical protein
MTTNLDELKKLSITDLIMLMDEIEKSRHKLKPDYAVYMHNRLESEYQSRIKELFPL